MSKIINGFCLSILKKQTKKTKNNNNSNLSVVVHAYKQPPEEHEMEIYSVLISANLESALHLVDCFL